LKAGCAVESDAHGVVRTQISQTKKLPLTQLIKALYGFEKGRGRQNLPVEKTLGKRAVEPLADPETGEVIIEVGTRINQEVLDRVPEKLRSQTILIETPLATNEDILAAFSQNVTLENPTVDDLTGKRTVDDIRDAEKAASGD
jgi:DNA-directed RNA polymerase subunit beta